MVARGGMEQQRRHGAAEAVGEKRRRGIAGESSAAGVRGVRGREGVAAGGSGNSREKRVAPGNRATRPVSPRDWARFAANRNPLDPTAEAPGIPMLATRPGAQDPTPRKFRAYGGFRQLRDF